MKYGGYINIKMWILVEKYQNMGGFHNPMKYHHQFYQRYLPIFGCLRAQ